MANKHQEKQHSQFQLQPKIILRWKEFTNCFVKGNRMTSQQAESQTHILKNEPSPEFGLCQRKKKKIRGGGCVWERETERQRDKDTW